MVWAGVRREAKGPRYVCATIKSARRTEECDKERGIFKK